MNDIKQLLSLQKEHVFLPLLQYKCRFNIRLTIE